MPASEPGPTLAEALARADLPPTFERWRTEIGAGTSRPTSAAEWAGCVVLVERGAIEVDCTAGGYRSFVAGDLLALGWLPLERIRNPGPEVARLLAVRRRGSVPQTPYLHVTHARGDDHVKTGEPR